MGDRLDRAVDWLNQPVNPLGVGLGPLPTRWVYLFTAIVIGVVLAWLWWVI